VRLVLTWDEALDGGRGFLDLDFDLDDEDELFVGFLGEVEFLAFIFRDRRILQRVVRRLEKFMDLRRKFPGPDRNWNLMRAGRSLGQPCGSRRQRLTSIHLVCLPPADVLPSQASSYIPITAPSTTVYWWTFRQNYPQLIAKDGNPTSVSL
jgi:hypothetical protein